ncbi:MAG: DUF2268 domain-containing putative Zn-dependent protease [Anaerolineaceae bacterium]|nr:DUF2268 domain-containing putative Zn-dependent protease [Anaerolineaceae bacterium]
MRFTVHPTLDILRELYTESRHPRETFRRAGPLLLDPGTAVEALYRARGVHGNRWPALEVMELVGCDGMEACAGAQGWGLFNPARSLEASAWEFTRYGALDYRAQVTAVLERLQRLLTLPDAEGDCLLLPCDSANRSLMLFGHGLSVYGAVPGLILLRLWPGGGVQERLPAALARAWAQTLRHLVHGRGTLRNLADFLVMEGIAAALIRRLQPDLPRPWLACFRRPVGWERELTRIARRWYDCPDYSDVVTNMYGARVVMGRKRPPPARPLDADTLALCGAVLADMLEDDRPLTHARALYGDGLPALNGHPPAGMPAWAGFEVGYRLVETWLRRRGATLADALRAPSAQIIAESRFLESPL